MWLEFSCPPCIDTARNRKISQRFAIYAQCLPLTIAWSANMSASAESTSGYAQNTKKSSIINRGLQDVLKIVSDALMGREMAPSVDKVELLASGGYNDVW